MKAIAVLMGTILVGCAIADAKPSKDVKEFCESLKGKIYWLRIEAVRMEGFVGKDVTNIYPDGQVYYIGQVGGLYQTKTKSVKEFLGVSHLIYVIFSSSGGG